MRYWIGYANSSRYDTVHKGTCRYAKYDEAYGHWVDALEDIENLDRVTPRTKHQLRDCGVCGGRGLPVDAHSKKTRARNAKFELLMGDLTKPRCGAPRTRHQSGSRGSHNPFGIAEVVNGSMFCELQAEHDYDTHAARTKAGAWFEWYPVPLSEDKANG